MISQYRAARRSVCSLDVAAPVVAVVDVVSLESESEQATSSPDVKTASPAIATQWRRRRAGVEGSDEDNVALISSGSFRNCGLICETLVGGAHRRQSPRLLARAAQRNVSFVPPLWAILDFGAGRAGGHEVGDGLISERQVVQGPVAFAGLQHVCPVIHCAAASFTTTAPVQ